MTINDKLVQLVVKWWTNSKVTHILAGEYSNGRLFVTNGPVGVFLQPHPFRPEAVLKGSDKLLSQESIARLIPKEEWTEKKKGHFTDQMYRVGKDWARVYTTDNGVRVGVNDQFCKQLILKNTRCDTYVARGCLYFVAPEPVGLYAVCAPYKKIGECSR